MFRRLHNRLGTAGLIVAIVAVVVALGGSALAASNALTGKQKREVKNIAKQYAGKDGSQGPAGQTGAPGPKGDAGGAGTNGTNGKDGEAGKDGTNGKDGEPGKDGTNGKNGENVNVIPLSKGDANCNEGGAKITNLSGTAYACNGASGESGDGTLPSGRTMRGYWIVEGKQAMQVFGSAVTAISFPMPVKVAPTETVLIGDETDSEAEKEKCAGTSEAPSATPGVLCLYVELTFTKVTLAAGTASTFGAGLVFGETDEALGSWAVKAP